MKIKDAIERLKDLIYTCDVGIAEHGECTDLFSKDKEALVTVINEFDKQNKIIKAMRKRIADEDVTEDFCDARYKKIPIYCDEDCELCIKMYFEKKVSED